MSLIDDIKRDREAGTKGPWELRSFQSGTVQVMIREWQDGKPDPTRDGSMYGYHSAYMTMYNIGWQDEGAIYREKRANASRIARVPDMEAALLAAEELEDAVRLEWDARSAWEDTPQDRGGPHGAKGRALAAWQMRRAELHVALTAFQKAVK